jgi:hypothetical protein
MRVPVDPRANPTVRKLARLGYAAKGLVYVVVGALAVQAAIGAGGQLTGPREALAVIGDQPFGQALLAVMALGLLGFASWRFVQSIGDADHEGSDSTGLVKRAGQLVSGLAHLGLAGVAVGLVLGNGGGGGGGLPSSVGSWAVPLVGAILVGVGLAQGWKAWSGSWREHLAMNEMSATERKWAERSALGGLAARGIVFVVLGSVFLAGGHADFADALGTIAGYGPLVLGLVALGLVLYGIYAFVEARYRRLGEPRV